MNQDDRAQGVPDAWDVALLGGAAASMYKSAPPKPAQPSADVTSLFRSKAGIPKDITPAIPPPPKASDVRAPLVSMPRVPSKTEVAVPIKIISTPASVAILAAVPKKQKLTPSPLPVAALPPAYPMRSVALHFMILFLGIPLFVGGFYLADYTKNSLGDPTTASVTRNAEKLIPAATATSTRTR